jgi:Tol biopolymer transport system component
MMKSAGVIRRVPRAFGLMAGVLALAAPGLVVLGCSKSPTQPPAAGPTKFMLSSSDRNRNPGNYRTQYLALDGSISATWVFDNSGTVTERHPSISQDGNTMVYEKSPGRGGSHDVIVHRLSPVATLDDPNVNTIANETDPYLSLDGKWLSFVRDTIGGRRIRLYDLVNKRFVPLTNIDPAPGSNDSDPALDAAGRRIAFVSDRNGNPDVYVYQVTTQSMLLVPQSISAGNDIEPAISGDGHELAWASDRSGGAGLYDIYLFDLNSALFVPFGANSPGNDRDPSLSNDGAYVVMASDFARPFAVGGYDLWNVNLASGTVWSVNGESSAGDDIDPVLVWP